MNGHGTSPLRFQRIFLKSTSQERTQDPAAVRRNKPGIQPSSRGEVTVLRYRTRMLLPALCLGLGCLAAAGTGTLHAQTNGGKPMSQIQAALDRPLLRADQPMAEVQDYLEGRIPKLQSYATARDWNREAERL